LGNYKIMSYYTSDALTDISLASANNVSYAQRVVWADIAKGIGIFLVIVGHSGLPVYAQWWIWSFHLPLFFFISGYFFSFNRYPNILSFLQKRARGLLLPYLFFSMFVLLGYYILDPSHFSLEVEVFIKHGWGGIALWFIPVLFLTELLYYQMNRLLSGKYVFLFLLLLSLIGYTLSIHQVSFPYKVHVVLSSIFFYGVGNMLRRKEKKFMLKMNQMTMSHLVISAIGLLIINIVSCFMNSDRLDLCFNVLGDYPYTYFSAFSGILFVVLVSHLIGTVSNRCIEGCKEVLMYLGSNTFILLALHQIFMMILIKGFADMENKLLSSLIRHPLLWLLLIGSVGFINSRAPFLLGKGKTGSITHIVLKN
jgi:acyltransferase